MAARPKINPYLSEFEVNLTQPELAQMHTYDLMRLLSYIRADRANMYKTMQIVRKAPDEAKKSITGYEELKEDGINLYREATARQKVVEQLLIDRIGYYPQRVDNKLLEALKAKIEVCEGKERLKAK